MRSSISKKIVAGLAALAMTAAFSLTTTPADAQFRHGGFGGGFGGWHGGGFGGWHGGGFGGWRGAGWGGGWGGAGWGGGGRGGGWGWWGAGAAAGGGGAGAAAGVAAGGAAAGMAASGRDWRQARSLARPPLIPTGAAITAMDIRTTAPPTRPATIKAAWSIGGLITDTATTSADVS